MRNVNQCPAFPVISSSSHSSMKNPRHMPAGSAPPRPSRSSHGTPVESLVHRAQVRPAALCQSKSSAVACRAAEILVHAAADASMPQAIPLTPRPWYLPLVDVHCVALYFVQLQTTLVLASSHPISPPLTFGPTPPPGPGNSAPWNFRRQRILPSPRPNRRNSPQWPAETTPPYPLWRPTRQSRYRSPRKPISRRGTRRSS